MEKPPVVLYLEPEPSLPYHPARDSLVYILAQRGCLLERIQVTPPFVERTAAIETWVESGRLKLTLLDEGLAAEARTIVELLQQVAASSVIMPLSHATGVGCTIIRPCTADSLTRIVSQLPYDRQPLSQPTVPATVRDEYDGELQRLRAQPSAHALTLTATLTRIVQEELRRTRAEGHGADYDGSYQRHVGFSFHPSTGQRCIVGGFGDHKDAIRHLRARIAAIRQWGVPAPGDIVFGTVTHGVPGYQTPILQILSIGVDWTVEDCKKLARFLQQTAMYLPVNADGWLIEG